MKTKCLLSAVLIAAQLFCGSAFAAPAVSAAPAVPAAPAAPAGVGGEDGAVVAAILAAVAQQCGPNAKVTSITKCN